MRAVPEHIIQRGRDLRLGVFNWLAAGGADVHHHAAESDAIGPGGSCAKIIDGPLANALVRGGQIHQVRRVRVRRLNVGLGDLAFEFVHLLIRVLGSLPALRRREEYLHALAAHIHRARNAGREAARG